MKAVIFPGQGAQYVGMGQSLYENFPRARALFDEIDGILGYGLSEKCFRGPEEDLKNTRFQQLAILAVSLSAFEALSSEQKKEVAYYSGLSLGEYSCLYAAGVLTLKEVVLLVRERAEAMEEAASLRPSVMCAVLGMTGEEAMSHRDMGFYVANLNAPQQTVISLAEEDRERVTQGLADLGFKVIGLPVSGGFHSPFMEPARERLRKMVGQLEFRRADVPIVSNVTARAHTAPEEIRQNLLDQLVSPVLWQRDVEYMMENGIETFWEVGPSRVLRGLIRKISREVDVRNFEKKEDFETADMPRI